MSDLDAEHRADEPVIDLSSAPDEAAPAEVVPAEAGWEATGEWPRIADYWPDGTAKPTGPRPQPSPDDGDPAPTRLISPPPRRERSWLRVVLGALGVLIFLGGSSVVLARLVSDQDDTGSSVSAAPTRQDSAGSDTGGLDTGGLGAEPNPPVSVAPPPTAGSAAPPTAGSAAPPTAGSAPPSGGPAGEPSATATALPFTSGTFELAGNVVDLNVTVAALGNDAVRVSSPDGSGLRPRTTLDGTTVRLSPNPDGTKGSGRVDVRLNSRIAWSVTMTGGVTTGSFDLDGGKVRRIDLAGGARRLDMTLPSSDSVIPIRMSGGVNTWRITTEEKVGVRVKFREGGGEAVLNGRRTTGIKRGTTLRGAGSDKRGLSILALAGLGTLTVAPDN